MTGLLGWLENTARDHDATKTLNAMAQAARAAHPLKTNMASAPAVLAAWQAQDAVDLHSTEKISVALLGQAHWNSDELQRLAERDGWAASVIQAYRADGPRLLERLHGPFALALLDAQSRVALLAIDRLGTQGLAFAQTPAGIVFATDARAVAAHPAVGDALDPQGLFNYLYFHMVPSPGSIFSGVEKLLPGQCIVWRDGRLERNFYWRLAYRDAGGENPQGKVGRFKVLLRDAVRTAADTPQVGSFLSGGTDSSTVAGMLAQSLSRPVDTFSIGFDAEGFDEMEYARLAARHFGTRPHEYYLTPQDVVAAIPKIAAAYDEPFGNASVIPTYYCAKLAHDAGIRVMLAGDGGDELFGGNARYAKQKVFEHYWRLPAWMRRHLIEPLSSALPSVALLGKAKRYIEQARIPLPERLETYNFLHRDPLDQILAPDFLAQVRTSEPEVLMREVYRRAETNSFINRMLFLDLKFILADNDLRKVSRACALAGVAVRYPLLDESLVNFSAELTPDDKVRGQYLRYFFKKALSDFLPPEIIDKSKHGFGLPFGLWMQTHPALRDLAHDSLAALRKRGIVQPVYIDRLLAQHRGGHASYYGVMIWVLMMLEQWLAAREAR